MKNKIKTLFLFSTIPSLMAFSILVCKISRPVFLYKAIPVLWGLSLGSLLALILQHFYGKKEYFYRTKIIYKLPILGAVIGSLFRNMI